MSKDALKGIAVYTAIIFGSIFILGLIIIVLMFLFPNLDFFGYSMIGRNKASDGVKTIYIDTNYTYSITLNTQSFNVEIETSDTINDRILYSYEDNCLGASKSSYTQTSEQKEGTSILLSMVEPTGILFYRSSRLIITVPNNINFDFTVKTESGNISIKDTKVRNLNITTENGQFSISHTGIDELNLHSLNINTKGGKFNFSGFDKVVVASPLGITAKKGDFVFKKLEANVKVRGEDVLFQADSIKSNDGSFEFNSANGSLHIGTLDSDSQNSIFTERCGVNINELYGITGISSIYGSINLGVLNSDAVVKSDNGNVIIEKAYGNLIAQTIIGNITVDTYYQRGDFTSEKGNITVKSVGDQDTNFTTNIVNKDGAVNLDNNINPVNILVTGKSIVTVKFWSMFPNPDVNHKIQATSGYCNIFILANNNAFKLKATGVVSGEISSLESIVSSDSYIVYPKNYEDVHNICSLDVIGGTVVFTALYER